MKKLKLVRNVLAVLAVLATVVFISCGAFFENEQNVTINLPPISSSARAISADKISDLKTATTSYRVTVTWNKPSNGDEPSGYHVYRSTKNDGTGFVRITESPVTALEFIDADTTGTIKAGEYSR